MLPSVCPEIRWFLSLWHGITDSLEPWILSAPPTCAPICLRKGTASSMSVPRQLRRLYKVPKSSRKFEPTFDGFYGSVEYGEITNNLDDAALGDFIDFLDEVRRPSPSPVHHSDLSINQVLQVENLRPGLFQKVLHSLWSICGRRGVLPRSHMISEGLSRTGGKEFASGGFANVWKAELVKRNSNPRSVCIKAMKVAVRDGEGGGSNTEKVGNSPQLFHPINDR